uniref:Secreted protein n=1 Tax=Romanomermis culicivorax TaxID=13658 RepID=A0A915IJK6_ROMCU
MVGPRVVLLAATISVAINSTRWKNRADAAGQPDDWSRYAIVGIFFEYRQFLVTAERVNIVDMPSSCQSSPRLVRLQASYKKSAKCVVCTASTTPSSPAQRPATHPKMSAATSECQQSVGGIDVGGHCDLNSKATEEIDQYHFAQNSR